MKGGDIKQFKELSREFSLIPLNGKIPIEKNWQQWCEKKRPFNPDDFKGQNAGIACGPASGIIVLDVDNISKFNEMIDEKGWGLPQTRVHITGTGKPHYIYSYPKTGRYGNRTIKDNKGESIFDIRGTGGQVVAPGSIHPETGKPYSIRYDLAIVPIPECYLSLNGEPKEEIQSQGVEWEGELSSLPISLGAKKLIKEGEPKGNRSEAIMSVLNSLVRAKIPNNDILNIFETYPIGEKYREKGQTKQKWLQAQIDKISQSKGNHAQGLSFMELEKQFSDKTEWFWREHIPRSLPSMINGREGMGKTTICLQIAKESLENYSKGLIVWLATEGFVQDTVVKMKDLGLTDNRFLVAQKSDGTFRFNLLAPGDIREIENLLNDLGEPILALFVDSLRGATILDDTESKMRIPMQILNALVCDKHKATLIYIHHFKKGESKDLLDKSAGNPAITASVREVLSVIKKSGYVRTLKQAKSNVAATTPELEVIKMDKEIVIREPSQESEEGQADRAEEFLINLFKDRHTILAKEVYEEGEKAGISSHPLKDAKKRLGIDTKHKGPTEPWFWVWNL